MGNDERLLTATLLALIEGKRVVVVCPTQEAARAKFVRLKALLAERGLEPGDIELDVRPH